MRFTPRNILALLLTAIAWSAMVASASATHLSVSSQHFRVIWRSLIFETTGGTGRLLCPVTLEGSFHSATIAKTLGSLIGYVTGATMRGEEPPCTGGTGTLLLESLPWHITYQGFTGTLPTLSGVILLLVGPAIRWRPSGSLSCLMRTEVRHPMQMIANVEAGGRITSLSPERGKSIPLTGEGGLCAFGGSAILREEEVGSVTTETGREVFIRLI